MKKQLRIFGLMLIYFIGFQAFAQQQIPPEIMKIAQTPPSELQMMQYADQNAQQRSQVNILKETDDLVVYQKIVQVWDNGAWVNQQQSIFTYGENPLPIEMVQQAWVAGQWINAFKFTYTYNEAGLPTFSMGYIWDAENSIWTEYVKMTYVYAEGGLLSELQFELFFMTSWITSGVNYYTYDASNRVIEILQKELDFESMQLINESITTFSFEGELLAEEISKYWLEEEGIWENDYKTTWTYLPEGVYEKEINMHWDGIGNWINYTETTATYDANWNLIEEFTIWWDNGSWVNYEMITRTYDPSGNILTILVQVWEAKGWVNSSMEENTYMTVGMEDFGALTNSNFELKVYPNPFAMQTKISFHTAGNQNIELSVLDLSGRSVYYQKLSNIQASKQEIIWNGLDFSGQQLHNGLYFIKLKSATHTEVVKVSIVR